ncbi:hypothetical protein [Aureispira anguillae]|uniref:DUF4625 domain-containing protein n=1 Tax=Aureispira anguillae TaxID=2864201 RepID=A0A915YC79_9BACT|nr:hypothetical protein [Aureispira anguillae]BDS10412.1 hypothetical protein AsAng_0011200 [Aureispira anguillae]
MKTALSLIFFIITLNFFSCTTAEEEVHNHISITIDAPANNSTVADPSAVEIDIDLTAEIELHDVEITLSDNNNTNIAPFDPMDVHVHAKSHHVHETINLSNYPAGSQFKLTVEACEDHDCAEKETKTITFSI